MPAEPRRSSRKVSSEEDIELKRARGEISCAECRRLKLKCDKKLPCGSCVRRGCTTICPNGSLSAGQGTRFILADTDQLHRKIAEMSERIRLLEDALAIFQAGVSSERHPLLRDDLLSIKFGPEVRRTIDDEASRNALAQSIDALGTLTIGAHGETKFIGRSGGSENLFMADVFAVGQSQDDPPLEIELETPTLDPEVAALSAQFPLTDTPNNIEDVLDKLESMLPPQPRAWALCEVYIEHFTWWFRPVKRDELINDILIPIYKARGQTDPEKKTYLPQYGPDSRCPHLLSVLFFVLAVGSLVDLTLPSCSKEAERYYQLARAALSLRSIFDSPEIETVQAVAFMASYHSLASSRYSIESGWAIMSLASRLAQGLGLHRDSAQWKLEPKVVQRRRNLFWEMFICEMFHCMALGRPPSLTRAYIDCELPMDEEQTLGENGEVIGGYWDWRAKFTQSVYTNVVNTLLTAKAPSYETVLDLDKQIRQTMLPPVKLYLKPEEDGYNNPGLCMKSYLMSQYRSIMMLGIHRTFFAQALLDHPANPLRSPYAPSFLAANRCASVLIKSFLHHFERCPDLCGRYWSIWTHAFTAAIILGSTVSRCPSATMAPSSLIELDLAIELFKRGAPQSIRARKALPILRALKEKATRSYQQFRNRHISPTLDIHLSIGPEDGDGSQERLAIFGGQTRVMTSRLLSRRKKHHSSSASTSTTASNSTSSSTTTTPATSNGTPSNPPGSSPQDPPSPTSSASTPSDNSSNSTVPQNVKDAFQDVHPSLVEYLSLFPANSSLAVVDPSQPLIEPPSLMSSRSASSMSSAVPSPFSPHFSPNTFPVTPQSSVSSAFAPPMQSSSSATPTAPDGLSIFSDLPQQPTQPPQSIADLQNLFAMDVGALPEGANPMHMGFSDEVLMNEQWMNLMRDAGIFDPPSSSASVPMNGVEATNGHTPTVRNIFGHEVLF